MSKALLRQRRFVIYSVAWAGFHLRSTLDTRGVTTRILKMRVLVLTGAGVSAESGIPTFRGKGGYWRNLDPAKLATPEAFARDPRLVWDWYCERRQRIRHAQPNAAHQAIVKLAQRAQEFLLVTQNVDGLHARAGMSAGKMVQIHGNIFVTRCSRCEFSRDDYTHDRSMSKVICRNVRNARP
jgi:NAD-dependent SIR2 family protein deacetylase